MILSGVAFHTIDLLECPLTLLWRQVGFPAHDVAKHDCRPLWCDSATCPDAYATPTTGGCPDGRSPQAGCQDTFNLPVGYTVELCPATGESCQDAVACAP